MVSARIGARRGLRGLGWGGLLLAGLLAAACSGGATGSTISAGSDAVTTSTAPSTTSSAANSGISVIEDELYRQPSDADGAGSTVDIYVGDGSEGRPLVVLLHGFGRSGPGRPDVDSGPLAEQIAKLGATVFYFGWQTAFGFSADSVADLSCVGPFIAVRAAEFGADPEAVTVVGHSMGAATGSMLSFSSFDLAPSPDCTESGQASTPVAFLGIAGNYGTTAEPLDDDHTRFRARTRTAVPFRDYYADEELLPGLSAAQLYQLDGYRVIPPVAELDIVLLVGSEDQYPETDADVTAAFAAALQANNIDVEVIIVEGANHDDIVDPTTEAGQETLQVLAQLLTKTR